MSRWPLGVVILRGEKTLNSSLNLKREKDETPFPSVTSLHAQEVMLACN